MELRDEPEMTTAQQAARDAEALIALYKSVSYAGAARPDPTDGDPDDDLPGDEAED